MRGVKRNILLNPGPATTTDTVKMALVVPDICPREKEFGSLFQGIRRDLVRIVKGGRNYTAVPFGGSGTAVMDSVINSVVPPGKKIAVIVNGAYGARMVSIAKTYKIRCVELNFKSGGKIDLSRVEQVLRSDRNIRCVAAVHHETTTGILNPISEIGKIAKKHRQVYIVDAISSYAAVPININACNIDFLLSTANKCIQGMAGIAFIICRKSELEKIKGYSPRSFYLNLYNQYRHLEETGQTPFTPPVQVAYALKQAIKEYFAEGGLNRFRRYTESWRILRKGLLDLGFFLLHKEEDESHILLTVMEPDDKKFNFDVLHDYLYAKGFTIYPGKIGSMNTFRLANMGAIDKQDMRKFLKVLAGALARMGVRH